MSARPGPEHGSTIPLILGFFLVALLVVAGSVAAADAFVQQRGLQDVCDGAAVASAGSAADLDRGSGVGRSGDLRFADVEQVVQRYLREDPSRGGVSATVAVSADATTVELTCSQHATVAFGAMFGEGGGVHQTAHWGGARAAELIPACSRAMRWLP